MPSIAELVQGMFSDDERKRKEVEEHARRLAEEARIQKEKEENDAKEKLLHIGNLLGTMSLAQQLKDLNNSFLKSKGRVEMENDYRVCSHTESHTWWGEQFTDDVTDHKHLVSCIKLIYPFSYRDKERRKTINVDYPIVGVGLILTTKEDLSLVVIPTHFSWDRCIEGSHSEDGVAYFENIEETPPPLDSVTEALAKAFYLGYNKTFVKKG